MENKGLQSPKNPTNTLIGVTWELNISSTCVQKKKSSTRVQSTMVIIAPHLHVKQHVALFICMRYPNIKLEAKHEQ